mgnify:CR=1 FL=1
MDMHHRATDSNVGPVVATHPIAFETLSTQDINGDGLKMMVRLKTSPTAPFQFTDTFVTLDVTDEDRDGIFVATDSFSTVFGEGSDPKSATADYLGSLFERYSDLERDEALLAPGLLRDLASLRQHLTRSR